MCVCCHPFILDVRFVDVPAGVTQEECHTGFLHLPSAVLALIFAARRIQPFLPLVDREAYLFFVYLGLTTAFLSLLKTTFSLSVEKKRVDPEQETGKFQLTPLFS